MTEAATLTRAAVPVLAIVDQPCLRCGKQGYFGYGLPPGPTLWACDKHRALVEQRAVVAGRLGDVQPMPRTNGKNRARK